MKLTHNSIDPWLPSITDWLDNKTQQVSVADILTLCLKVPAEEQNWSARMRVADCLKQIDWKRLAIGSEQWVSPHAEAA